MPWKAVGKKIVRADTGKVVGHSKSHAMAEASVRARYSATKAEHRRKISRSPLTGSEALGPDDES